MKSVANLLAQKKEMSGINLEGNDLTHIGARLLATALKDNKTVRTLSLKCNQIGDLGAKALAEVIETTAIQVLDLSCCDIGTAGWTALCVKLSGNEHIIDLSLANANLQGYELIHCWKMLLSTPS